MHVTWSGPPLNPESDRRITPKGGGFYNRRYRDFCTSADTSATSYGFEAVVPAAGNSVRKQTVLYGVAADLARVEASFDFYLTRNCRWLALTWV